MLHSAAAKVQLYALDFNPDLDKSFFGEPLVDFWSIGDVLCTVGIVKGGESLLDVALSRGDGGYDGGLGTPTK